jgi:site-specific DNA-methyltransferase (adenine-specific)
MAFMLNAEGSMTHEKVQIGDCTLYCGDCLDVLPTLTGVDAVVTDPPYGVALGKREGMPSPSGKLRRHGLAKASYDVYEDTYDNFVALIIPRLNAALDVAHRAAVFTGPHIQEQRKATAFGGVYCPVGSGRHAWGFKTFHPVLLYGKAPELHKGAKPTILKDNGYVKKNGHPCPKPLAWIEWLVGLTSRPGNTVFDPFLGSGTTGVACVNAGRRFIGVELSREYFDIACRRIERAYADQPLLTGGAV